MTRTLSILALMTLTACGSAIQPLSGEYTIQNATPGVDTCGLGDEADLDDEPFTLTVTDDAVDVTIGETGDGGVSFDCVMEKDEMVCDDFVQTQDVGGSDGDAEVTIAWSLGGTFADETTIESGMLALDYSCAGADCDAFSQDAGVDLPCQTEFTFTASM